MTHECFLDHVKLKAIVWHGLMTDLNFELGTYKIFITSYVLTTFEKNMLKIIDN